MPSTLLTIDMVTNEALRLFINTNSFIMQVDRQYDDQFGRAGGKIGDTLRIRKPLDYTVGSSSTITPQDSTEQDVVLTLATLKNVGLQFTDSEKVLEMDMYSDRYIKPAVNKLVGAVAKDLMSVINGVPNFVSLVDGSSNIISPTIDTWLSGQARLNQMSLDVQDRKVFMDPRTQARTVSSNAGLFNPQPTIGGQLTSGVMGKNFLGMDWYMDQTVQLHTTGSYSGSLNVANTANQTGSAITVAAVAGGLNAGDIVSFAGVHAVNRVTGQSTGELAQFVLTSNVAPSGTTLNIYPPLTPTNGGQVIYATVDASPAANAIFTVATKSAEVYRQNFILGEQSVTFCTADLALPTGAVVECSRKRYDGVSLRVIQDFVTTTASWITRLDILYGFQLIRPEWVCIVADKV